MGLITCRIWFSFLDVFRGLAWFVFCTNHFFQERFPLNLNVNLTRTRSIQGVYKEYTRSVCRHGHSKLGCGASAYNEWWIMNRVRNNLSSFCKPCCGGGDGACVVVARWTWTWTWRWRWRWMRRSYIVEQGTARSVVNLHSICNIQHSYVLVDTNGTWNLAMTACPT